jgi:hypothetical protein
MFIVHVLLKEDKGGVCLPEEEREYEKNNYAYVGTYVRAIL